MKAIERDPLRRLVSRVRGLIRADAQRARDRPSPAGAGASSPQSESTATARAPATGRPVPHADLPRLEAEARYHRDRLALYRARLHGSKPTSQARLEELERTSVAADARLRDARRP